MKLSRIDLDGVGSPMGLVTRICQLEPDLPIPVPIEELCERLDIIKIAELETDGFEAALLTDMEKSNGAILVAKGRSRARRRYSIGHELGHFLMPFHVPGADGQILCSREDLLRLDTKEQDRRMRMEAEANQFAALLLMPPPALRKELEQTRTPNLGAFVAAASRFDVSKQALAPQYVAYHREPVALVQTESGRVRNIYRNPGKFPWIDVLLNGPAPDGSLARDASIPAGTISEVTECEPELWLSADAGRTVETLTEQVLYQREGFALTLLHAEIRDEGGSDGDPYHAGRW